MLQIVNLPIFILVFNFRNGIGTEELYKAFCVLKILSVVLHTDGPLAIFTDGILATL